MIDPRITLAAQQLVVRARAGDENAMGMIVAVKQNADRGVARAKDTVSALNAYIKANPAPGASMGAESRLTGGARDVLAQIHGITTFGGLATFGVVGARQGSAAPPTIRGAGTSTGSRYSSNTGGNVVGVPTIRLTGVGARTGAGGSVAAAPNLGLPTAPTGGGMPHYTAANPPPAPTAPNAAMVSLTSALLANRGAVSSGIAQQAAAQAVALHAAAPAAPAPVLNFSALTGGGGAAGAPAPAAATGKRAPAKESQGLAAQVSAATGVPTEQLAGALDPKSPTYNPAVAAVAAQISASQNTPGGYLQQSQQFATQETACTNQGGIYQPRTGACKPGNQAGAGVGIQDGNWLQGSGGSGSSGGGSSGGGGDSGGGGGQPQDTSGGGGQPQDTGASGYPTDPSTGYPYDPTTGQLLDPNTGLPLAPGAAAAAPPIDPSAAAAAAMPPVTPYRRPWWKYALGALGVGAAGVAAYAMFGTDNEGRSDYGTENVEPQGGDWDGARMPHTDVPPYNYFAPGCEEDVKSILELLSQLGQAGGYPALYAGCVAIANGPLLTNARVGQMMALLPQNCQDSFSAAFRNPGAFHPAMVGQDPASDAGKAVGMARRIQAVRMPRNAVSKFDANVGWELGETSLAYT